MGDQNHLQFSVDPDAPIRIHCELQAARTLTDFEFGWGDRVPPSLAIDFPRAPSRAPLQTLKRTTLGASTSEDSTR